MDPAIWRANLAALRRRHPLAADAVEAAEPACLQWAQGRDGAAVASIDHDGRPLAMCSKYAPLDEARALIDPVDLDKAACVAVLGCGVGHHVAALADRLSRKAVLVVYEPDAGLLRAVLERVDHSGWLGADHVVLMVGEEVDRGQLIRLIEPRAMVVTQGTQLVSHPPTRRRHAAQLKAFADELTAGIDYCRMSIATVLVNGVRTCHNLAMNLPHYTAGETVNDLYQAAAGRPAVLVGAGPSLVKNVDLLTDPAVRNNVVLITVQTCLKPLLDRGIRPDFVTALDYSAICTRFYEGLPDLPDVTLVAEPKANPAILDAFPGPIRICRSEFNDHVLGNPADGGLSRPMRHVPAGATVAHLSFYVAQLLGCDPIIMIGQDLGFSDGLYYAPGTPVHQVWSSELGAFNTIEMMEWTRIVRMRGHLSRHEDVHGRPIFSDQQMIAYLRQFERDFAAAPQTVIDATQGGMPKLHTTRMTLAEALAEHATQPVPPLPQAQRNVDADRLTRLGPLLDRRVEQVQQLGRTTRASVRLLEQMQVAHGKADQSRLASLFAKLKKHQARVHGELGDAFAIVSLINSTGGFERNRQDRLIDTHSADGRDREARQMQRDLANLKSLLSGVDEAVRILRDARGRVADVSASPPSQGGAGGGSSRPAADTPAARPLRPSPQPSPCKGEGAKPLKEAA